MRQGGACTGSGALSGGTGQRQAIRANTTISAPKNAACHPPAAPTTMTSVATTPNVRTPPSKAPSPVRKVVCGNARRMRRRPASADTVKANAATANPFTTDTR